MAELGLLVIGKTLDEVVTVATLANGVLVANIPGQEQTDQEDGRSGSGVDAVAWSVVGREVCSIAVRRRNRQLLTWSFKQISMAKLCPLTSRWTQPNQPFPDLESVPKG